MRVLMLPSMHPYVSKLSYGGKIEIVNPNSDYFALPDFGVEFFKKTHHPNSYDVVHIHFSFDKVNLDNLRSVLEYFKQIKKEMQENKLNIEGFYLDSEFQSNINDYLNWQKY